MNNVYTSSCSSISAARVRACTTAWERLFAIGVPAVLWFAGMTFTGAVSTLGATADAASQWPQWRGPLASGVAPLGNPPTTWSETENVRWKVKVPGAGTGTPIVWGNQIFLQTAVVTEKKAEPAVEKKTMTAPAFSVAGLPQAPANPPAGGGGERRPRPRGGPGGPGGGMGSGKPSEVHQFVILSIDRATGQTQWQKTVREEVPHEGHHRDHGFASHSPITDGKQVFAWFGSRGIHCYDLKGGLRWEKDLGRFRSKNGFGEGNSPALFENTLVVNWDHEGDDFIAAFDKNTGKELWRQPRDEQTTWTTPLVVVHEGKPQVVVTATKRIRSYDLATGKQIWECAGMTANVIPTPVSDFGMVYAISGFGGASLLAIKLGQTGDLTATAAIVWRHEKSTPYVPSPLLYGERLYFFSGNNAVISCFDARNGKPLIDAERLEGPSGFYASPVGAGGRVYLAGRNGTSIVLKDSGKLEILATNKLDEKFDASPAVVGKELFLRGHEHLYCIAEK